MLIFSGRKGLADTPEATHATAGTMAENQHLLQVQIQLLEDRMARRADALRVELALERKVAEARGLEERDKRDHRERMLRDQLLEEKLRSAQRETELRGALDKRLLEARMEAQMREVRLQGALEQKLLQTRMGAEIDKKLLEARMEAQMNELRATLEKATLLQQVNELQRGLALAQMSHGQGRSSVLSEVSIHQHSQAANQVVLQRQVHVQPQRQSRAHAKEHP